MATIAVIDDEQVVRDVLREMLIRVGHTVVCFPDAAPFLKYVDANLFDLVITDFHMPTCGEQVVAAMAQKGFPAPVIVMSGNMTNEIACLMLAMGAHAVLQKPMRIQNFLAVVRKWLTLRPVFESGN